MSTEKPYEILHLPEKLHADFDGKLLLAQTGNDAQREVNFLSRALAAYTMHKVAGCSLDEAAASVVDGGSDGGIDAVHFSPTSNTLWLIQSKYDQSGRGQPDLQSITRFKTGTEQLLQGDFSEIEKNPAWNAKLDSLKGWLAKDGLRVKVITAYSGAAVLGDDRVKLFEDLRRRFNHEDDYVEFKSYSLVSIHDWVTGADQPLGIDKVELEILTPGWFRDPYETIYGKIKISDLVAMYRAHGPILVAANIRRYKGSSAVNEEISKTAKNEPQSLFYLNNGLTAYCNRLEINNIDRDNKDKKKITAHGLCVVNGAQTLGSLDLSYPDGVAIPPDSFVFIKIISLERCEDDRGFARRITESTNLQNQIGPKDFVAIDEQQERIAAQLKLAGVEYHYKDGENIPDLDEQNFNLDHATVTLACLDKDAEFNLCSRINTNRRSLWSTAIDQTYPETEMLRTRYERVFRPDHSARTIWRAVQTYALVVKAMQNDGRTATGVRKPFYQYCRWLVLKMIFVTLRPEQGEEITLPTAVITSVTAKAQEIAETLWSCYETQGFGTGEPHPRSVFSKPDDLRRLYDATMVRLAAATATNTLPKTGT